ncbi:MAG: adenylate kinase [Candidatus Kerfeldbacteria bacterium RIFOXYC2_FULL_38_9]|nr:MAG: adenylate kinase [Candidatus Kerfeldbacteria bacterium RIFOXYC2_FULL_38_9]
MTDFKKIVLFGPQGSGKGTQAERLSGFFGIPQLAPGNIFRKAVAEATDLGKKVELILKQGNLVPDEITNAIMKERLEQEDCLGGFILDGYPRNKTQADELDALTNVSHVLLFKIPDQESVHRLSQRRVCSHCGATYHLEFKKPVQENVCDFCGHNLYQRDDDKPAAISKRLKIFHQETEPLLVRYEQRAILYTIDGLGPIAEVWQRIQDVFKQVHD